VVRYKEKVDEVIDVSEEHDFFPLLCALYQKDNRVDIKSFFEKPFNFYTAEIDYLSALLNLHFPSVL
jgi:hypothetical protein